jgi:Rrf2 family protein
MRLSARVDYALRAAAELAVAAGDHPVTAVQLAEAQQIPPKFLENILGQLRRSGIIRSQRGPEGGYWLAKPADEITMADIIRAIDGPLLGVRGERPEHVGYEGAARSLQEVWIALRASERSILEQVTLAHLGAGVLPDIVQKFTQDPAAWDSPAFR